MQVETRPGDHPVRLREVASKAGVSLATASQVFNGRRPVSPQTRERVLRAASEIGYQHYASPARDLNIGIIYRAGEVLELSNSLSSSWAEFTGTLVLAGLRRGVSIVSVTDAETVTTRTAKFDGFILLTPVREDPLVQHLVELNVPVVSVESVLGAEWFRWWVGFDHVAAFTEIVGHLADEGARRACFLLSASDTAQNAGARRAFQAACALHGVEGGVRVLPQRGMLASACEATISLLDPASRTGPASELAILASSGDMIAGVLAGVSKLGLSAPEDVLVASTIDGPSLMRMESGVTSLQHDAPALATALLDLLALRMRGGEMNRGMRIGMSLQVRHSSNRAAVEARRRRRP